MNFSIDWKDLKIGHTYFTLTYSDPARTFPYIETLVYRGSDSSGAEDIHVFEYASAMRGNSDSENVPEEESTTSYSGGDPSCVSDLGGLIHELELLQARLTGK